MKSTSDVDVMTASKDAFGEVLHAPFGGFRGILDDFTCDCCELQRPANSPK